MSEINALGKGMIIRYLTDPKDRSVEQIVKDGQDILEDFFNSLEEATIPVKRPKVQKLNKTLSGKTQVLR